MIRIVSLLLVFFFATDTVCSQKFDYQLEFKDIQRQSKDSSSAYFYPRLLERFLASDTTLTNREIIAAQIGFTATEHYRPYRFEHENWKIFRFIDANQHDKTISICDSILGGYPFHFIALMEKAFAHKLSNRPDSLIHKKRFQQILDALYWSGDGTRYRPYFVLGPTDILYLRVHIMGECRSAARVGRYGNGTIVECQRTWVNDAVFLNYFYVQHMWDCHLDDKVLKKIEEASARMESRY